MIDVLIIGAGVSGVSCALILGSAQNKPFAMDKKIAIVAHQKRLRYKMPFLITLTEFPLGN